MKTANIRANNQNYKRFILIENMLDFINYQNEVLYGMVKESASNLIERAQNRVKGKYVEHAKDVITNTTEILNDIVNRGIIYKQAEIMAGYYENIENYILEGKRIAINPFNMVSFFTLSDGDDVEILTTETKYTKEDIRVKRWYNGVHWYAKIGLVDVVIDGEQIWGAKWVAQKKAEEFLESL